MFIAGGTGLVSLLVLLTVTSLPLWNWIVIGSQLISAGFALLSLAVITGGAVCIWRDNRDRLGEPDYIAASLNRTPKPRLFRGRRPRPGDLVRVKAPEEIRATLDQEGCCEHLPFMEEMLPYCGKVFRVHRRMDKINDMRNKTGVRRFRDAVTLQDARCDGSQHGGCQAGCFLIWKDEWLERLDTESLSHSDIGPDFPVAHPGPETSDERDKTYICQMTRLWEASEPMSRWDIRQDIRPLIYGNIGIGPFLVAIVTRLFNSIQRARGGAGYPHMPVSDRQGRTPNRPLGLERGDEVAIRSKQDISGTLVDGRNRGLWFDTDMIRFCGRRDIVRTRVERVIHEATGKMVRMKTPCVVLENAIATGEFLRLCPQHEYIFWRETWLDRVNADSMAGPDNERRGLY
jgi:hypothetical protein